MTRLAPEGFKVKGTSTYYDQDGNIRGQWVKTDIDLKRQEEIIREAIEAMKDDIPRLDLIPPATKSFSGNLCSCYVITDYHLSMLSHHEETGARLVI